MSGPFGATPWMYDHTDFYPLDINQSLKFNDDESQYLSWTPAAAGNRKTWTWSGWVKRGNLGGAQTLFARNDASVAAYIIWNSNNKLEFAAASAGIEAQLITTPVYRDASAFYHIVMAFDTTQATASDRIKFYINGVQITSLDTASYPSQNYDGYVNTTQPHYLGSGAFSGTLSNYFDGYLSDVYFIDGQALDPTSFGEFKEGIWIPRVYNGTYGSNGFHLPFKNDDTVEGFNTVTYRGDGNNTASISGLGFSPDLLWIKNRTDSSNQNLMDSVRGASVRLLPSSTLAEVSSFLGSFDGDGFTFSGGNDNDVNQAGDSYVAWAWDAGSGSAASNTDGSITSTVKANPSYGFSVVTASASGTSPVTVGHGLGVQPKMIIGKVRDVSSTNWYVYSSQIAASDYLVLNSSAAKATSSNIWDIAPTSTVFTVGNPQNGWSAGNSGTHNYVLYCFSEVSGYSSIGSYSGTGAANNAVTGLGFKPAWIMIKNATDLGSSGESWYIFDNTRDTVNPAFHKLNPNSGGAESTSTVNNTIDFTSDGFDINTTNAGLNYNGDTYIYMAFADTREAAFWKDVSGNDNNWTPVNLDYRDSLPDSTTNNFCTGNPLKSFNGGGGSAMVYAEGNLKLNRPGTGTGWASSFGTMSVSSGKWYWEAKCFDSGSADEFIGIHEANTSMFQILGYSGDPTGYSYNASSGNKYNNNTGTSYGASYADGDVIGVALDMDAGTVTFYKNGASQGTAFTGLSGNFIPAFSSDYSTGYGYWIANFGQDSTFSGATTAGGNQDDNGIGDFKYAPPSGYFALCTSNLPTPTIVDGSEYFNTVLYTGNGSTQSITGVGFGSAPDFVWTKTRSPSGYGHSLFDVVRGGNERLDSSATQEGRTNEGNISFQSDGFNVTSSYPTINNNTSPVVAWNWKAGGTAVSNTDGSITSQVSANVDAGFSIVSYTRTSSGTDTIGHGLGQKPSVVIYKSRSTGSWYFTHELVDGSYDFLTLNTTDTNSNITGALPPTSSVFSNTLFGASENFIAYCFADVEGFSKVGSYTGNGSADGPFIYTGFRPAFVMIKRTDDTKNWHLSDNKRDVANPEITRLFPNLSNAENAASGYAIDFVSQGIKIRNTDSDTNASGGTYIYLAFAKNPFKYSNAR